ncbi:MAG TPA: M42 family metallopeptidase [Ktedonobacterales bacterium]|jgi:endoglucanase|nr:M42 family metallopeptidase [Ktedonobacterales bacterium]
MAVKTTSARAANKANHAQHAKSDAMHGVNLDLLRRLSETPGVSGREEQVRAIVVEQLKPLVDELSVDALGNVIAIKRGSSDRKVMLAAHMDEIGFMARYIDERGFVRIQPLGGFDPRTLVAQRVVVHTRGGERLRGVLTPATKPIHLLGDERPGTPKLEEFYVDLGLPGERVKELVSLGDSITMDRTFEQVGENVIGKAMDDRTGVFTMIEALRQLGKHSATVIAVATVQEEVGLRGATTSAFAVQPDVAIAIDTTLAVDTPGMPDTEAVTRLGEGVAIKVFDSSFIPNFKLVGHLREVAERHAIRHQMEVLPRGGTDAGAMQRARGGAAAITISIPSRYVHTVNEMISVADLDAAAKLLARYLEDAHSGTYTL